MANINRLTRAKSDVLVVEQELRDRADFSGPFAGAKNAVERAEFGLIGLLRPNEHLRNKQDRFVALALNLKDRLKKRIAFGLLASGRSRRIGDGRDGGRIEQRFRTFQKESR